MKEIKLESSFVEYASIDELSDEDKNLVKIARESAANAYAPYSRFNVGAALILENGTILRGNNQENASYPIGLCAERVAIFASGANFPDQRIKTLAVTAFSKQFVIDKPITPCGACRQAISEYENRHKQPIKIVMVGESGKVLVSNGIKNFLPYQFNADDLKVKI